MFAEGLVKGSTHTCQGQEAVSVAVAAAATHRRRGHVYLSGTRTRLGPRDDPDEVMGEVLGKTVGSIGGVGGSMHLSDPSIGLLAHLRHRRGRHPRRGGGRHRTACVRRDSIGIAPSATGPPTSGLSTRPSTWPPSGTSRWSSSVRTTSTANTAGSIARHRSRTSTDGAPPTTSRRGPSTDRMPTRCSRAVHRVRGGQIESRAEIRRGEDLSIRGSLAVGYRALSSKPGELDEWLLSATRSPSWGVDWSPKARSPMTSGTLGAVAEGANGSPRRSKRPPGCTPTSRRCSPTSRRDPI
jgi:hypothetical protein